MVGKFKPKQMKKRPGRKLSKAVQTKRIQKKIDLAESSDTDTITDSDKTIMVGKTKPMKRRSEAKKQKKREQKNDTDSDTELFTSKIITPDSTTTTTEIDVAANNPEDNTLTTEEVVDTMNTEEVKDTKNNEEVDENEEERLERMFNKSLSNINFADVNESSEDGSEEEVSENDAGSEEDNDEGLADNDEGSTDYDEVSADYDDGGGGGTPATQDAASPSQTTPSSRLDSSRSENINYTLLSGDRALLELEPGTQLHFRGTIQVKLIRGIISFQGYEIKPEDKFSTVYSPNCQSAISLRALKSRNLEEENKKLKGFIENIDKLTETSIVAVFKKNSESWIDFMTQNTRDMMDLFSKTEVEEYTRRPVPVRQDRLTGLDDHLAIRVLRQNSSDKFWMEGGDWNIALTSLQITRKNGDQPKLIALGGKSAGKSSFLRWLMNKFINKQTKVLFLDLDPGQREFGLPSYMSLSLIDKPALGPNFCQPAPEWEKPVFFGDIDVSQNPRRYLKCVSLLMRELKKCPSEYPVLVNTMGWVQGLGLSLNLEVVKKLKPTTLVQIHSSNRNQNCNLRLTSSIVASKESRYSQDCGHLSYSLLEFPSVPGRESGNKNSKNSKLLRDIKTLSWMIKQCTPSSLPVYSIPYSNLALNMLHGEVPDRGLMAALAGRLVDLCHAPEETIRQCNESGNYSLVSKSPVAISLGVGIIRGIDANTKTLYLAPYLQNKSDLDQVNCLVNGNLSMPLSLVKNQRSGPYLTKVDKSKENPMDTPFNKMSRQGFMPAAKIRSQNNATLESLEQQNENQEGSKEART